VTRVFSEVRPESIKGEANNTRNWEFSSVQFSLVVEFSAVGAVGTVRVQKNKRSTTENEKKNGACPTDL
jgi:hypothetical protein